MTDRTPQRKTRLLAGAMLVVNPSPILFHRVGCRWSRTSVANTAIWVRLDMPNFASKCDT